MQFKKASKVSWEKLGIPDPTATPVVVKKVNKSKGKKKPVSKAKKAKVIGELRATHKISKTDLAITASVITNNNKESARERIHKLLAVGLGSFGVGQSIIKIKRESKKSWEVLGVPEDIVTQLNAYQMKK